MILIDSNIIIYSAIEKYSFLRKLYEEDDTFVSNGDSIVSATAIINKLILYTNNEDDFKKVRNLKVFNPLLKN